MKRRVLSMNYTANHADDGIARIIGVVMTSCGAAALFIAGSTYAMAESGIASVYAYSSSKPRAANAQIRRHLPLHIVR
jgi:hypothetical protein